MSEDHGVECPKEDEKQTDETGEKVVENEKAVLENGEVVVQNDEPVVENAEECPMTVDTDEPSANTSKEDSAIDAIDKETLSSEVDEKKDLYGANERATLTWTAEGNQFKIAWSLPEGAATADDYIALCCTGKEPTTKSKYSIICLILYL